MLNLNSVMIGTKQTKVLAAFYEKVLGKPAEMVDVVHGFYGWQVGATYFSILDHSEMVGRAKDPGRVILNFETQQVKEEFERFKSPGMYSNQRTLRHGGGWISTLADPDGITFN